MSKAGCTRNKKIVSECIIIYNYDELLYTHLALLAIGCWDGILKIDFIALVHIHTSLNHCLIDFISVSKFSYDVSLAVSIGGCSESKVLSTAYR